MMQHAYDLNKWALPSPGDTVGGKYVVEGACGRGRLSVVLAAIDAGRGRRVALKVLLPEWAEDPEVVQRFVRQGLAARRIKNGHAIRVVDVGMLTSATPYLVLEFQDGQNLSEIVAAGPLPVAEAVDFVLQASEAVAEAHSYGIIHRDLKLQNLFLTHGPEGGGWIRVGDFGAPDVIASLVRSNDSLLRRPPRPTDPQVWPQSMAPEQLRATKDVGEGADIWALGNMLHELLTGKAPFAAESLQAMGTAILTKAPEPISSLRANVPREVERAILRCLEKDPQARFGSVAEFARAIAPFGTTSARESRERIEGILFRSQPDLSLPPPAPDGADDWSSAPYARGRSLGEPVSGKMIFGSLLLMAGLGAGAFITLYESVHGHATTQSAARIDPVVAPPRLAFPSIPAPPSAEPPPPDPAASAPSPQPVAVAPVPSPSASPVVVHATPHPHAAARMHAPARPHIASPPPAPKADVSDEAATADDEPVVRAGSAEPEQLPVAPAPSDSAMAPIRAVPSSDPVPPVDSVPSGDVRTPDDPAGTDVFNSRK